MKKEQPAADTRPKFFLHEHEPAARQCDELAAQYDAEGDTARANACRECAKKIRGRK